MNWLVLNPFSYLMRSLTRSL
uniref:Uncharacterized protein n=1 Tax=Rhizophora mucronata TaxID=61149 RepID=A0A2P2ND11_RHIMU